jgi:hypothetical protein
MNIGATLLVAFPAIAIVAFTKGRPMTGSGALVMLGSLAIPLVKESTLPPATVCATINGAQRQLGGAATCHSVLSVGWWVAGGVFLLFGMMLFVSGLIREPRRTGAARAGRHAGR